MTRFLTWIRSGTNSNNPEKIGHKASRWQGNQKMQKNTDNVESPRKENKKRTPVTANAKAQKTCASKKAGKSKDPVSDIRLSAIIYLRHYREIENLKQGLYRYGLQDARVRFFPEADGVALQYPDKPCNRAKIENALKDMQMYIKEYDLEIYDLKARKTEYIHWPVKVPKVRKKKV